MTDMDKTVRRYTGIYRKALTHVDCADAEAETREYAKRLAEMYASEEFRKYSVYPTTNTVHVFAVIAMCLGLKKYGLDDSGIIDAINSGFSRRRNFFRRLIRCIDVLPNAYRIAEKWNISDHDRRVKDGSLTYDFFRVTEGKIEYRISKCVYIEMFEHYGIRSLCRIFCMTDTTSYENLPKHVVFIRHSDLSDGDCCHDEIMDRRRYTGTAGPGV